MKIQTPKPQIYYGWLLVITLAITETVSFGVLYYAFTVFIRPMQAELGWSRAEMTGAFSLALVLSGLSGLIVGRWLDRHGPRLLMAVGSCIAAVLVLAWSAVDNLTVFYLIWAGLGVSMAAVFYEPAFVVVATWFRHKRGRALTLLTFLAGFASVIFIPLAEWLVSTQGWRSALVILALILAIITIPLHALVLRRRPEDLGLQPDGAPIAQTDNVTAIIEHNITLKEALRGRSFWWLSGAFTFNTLAIVAIGVHLVPYLSDQGYDPAFAATAGGLIGIMALPGRLIFTPLGERLPRKLVTAFIFLLQTLSLLVLLLIQNVAGVLIFVALFGAGFGAITPLRAGLVAEFYGRKHYGSISSVLALCTTVARGIAPVSVGIIHDSTGSYNPALWALVGCSLIAAFIIPLAEKPTIN